MLLFGLKIICKVLQSPGNNSNVIEFVPHIGNSPDDLSLGRLSKACQRLRGNFSVLLRYGKMLLNCSELLNFQDLSVNDF